MQINLSQKERMILEDGKHQEDVCVKKYQSFANQAKDPNLKQLLNKLASEEQHHYNIINELLQGKKPNLTHSNQSMSNDQTPATSTANNMSFNNPEDALLCSDLLATEKYVSGFYDTGVFESANKDVREALQHIQKEEQRHGEELFNYMHTHGMYNVK
ncbi:spore coat protein [Tissierella carlieri]|uniref:Spore coat protein n=1 Tax=Tissierella carlieri TaxID=689904 RepID=A0ABT1SFI6_9FIRM|nr:spore coat protein [Tissierella carlieri]MBU5313278.1 spore coat protein [Tissierella carlieri]MCQ4925250.1 spore coat protein [Tissierella carlieri]